MNLIFITIFVAIVLVLAIVFGVLYFRLKSKIVTLSDIEPYYGLRRSKKWDAQKRVLKLQNEIMPYIKVKDHKVFLKVVKED